MAAVLAWRRHVSVRKTEWRRASSLRAARGLNEADVARLSGVVQAVVTQAPRLPDTQTLDIEELLLWLSSTLDEDKVRFVGLV